MVCLNCNKELNHTPGKRKKQFCSPDCRVRYWQKNKPKKEPVLSDLIEVRKEQDAFCERSGFMASQLIEKFKQLEAQNGELLEKIKGLEAENGRLLSNKFIGHFVEGQKKPIRAPEAPKPPNVPKKKDNGGKEAQNGHEGNIKTWKGFQQKAIQVLKENPLPSHPLWKAGDPKENSGAFFLKYECNNYEELQKLKK